MSENRKLNKQRLSITEEGYRNTVKTEFFWKSSTFFDSTFEGDEKVLHRKSTRYSKDKENNLLVTVDMLSTLDEQRELIRIKPKIIIEDPSFEYWAELIFIKSLNRYREDLNGYFANANIASYRLGRNRRVSVDSYNEIRRKVVEEITNISSDYNLNEIIEILGNDEFEEINDRILDAWNNTALLNEPIKLTRKLCKTYK